jgi:L-histidine Nalpha-methyltransferase
MQKMIDTEIHYADVAKAVEVGFSQSPKCLPSWLFYDEIGDKIFQEIMRMPEYYLTACEYEILQMNKALLLKCFDGNTSQFHLVELGAGDGLKTEILLRHFNEQQASFVYSPIDVSESVLYQLQQRLQQAVPGLDVQPINKRYDEALASLAHDHLRKVFLFMGANIGNFSVKEATKFIASIADVMQEEDQLLIGFDLKKDPRMIQAAYDDPHGITRDFNLNLLVRLNRELGADFQLDQFSHYPYYDPETGTTKSYLVSLREQDVYLEACERAVHFNRWEIIHTEISQKYDMTMIRRMASEAGLIIEKTFYDCKHYFCDVLLTKKT